jgi:tetratricopeptide (TPR) repeat protein
MGNKKIKIFDLVKRNGLIFGFLLILIFLTTSCETWYNPSLSNLPNYQIEQIYKQDKLECDNYAEAKSKGYCNSLAQTAADSNNALVKINAVTGCLSHQHLLFIECMEAKGWQVKKKEQNGSNENEVNKKSQNYQLALSRSTAINMLDLGSTYTDLKNFSEAKYYLTQGLEMVKKLGDKHLEANAYVGFGKLYLAQNQENLAKEYFTKAYNLFKEIGNDNDAQKVYKIYLKQ